MFLSRRKVAMLVQLRPTAGTEIPAAEAALSLRYETAGGVPMAESLAARYDGQPLDEHGRYLPQRGLAKTVALALLVSGMRQAADEYQRDHAAAVATMETVAARFAADAAAIGDPALDREVDFAEALLALMRADAPQGNLYGN